ncbi:hypothetical protein ABL78_0441 [Leptomonas seymouri]|uniref:Uncharacterized protein n=1 Tax=Leptomonas seymouri TaxID=5684 RepID=A0A0N1IMJ7_LEPSE|nr:hypothetical protein ABL78_0441 [Leptomonas seymouri]|eukprot:KPI90511.1 hypothetical protein ABL78_0441 [Leptomonas seymouri]
MNQLADKVVAYRLPDEGNEEMYGICIRREGDTLRVMVLQKEDNREAPLKTVLRKLSDEDGIVNSLESRFNSLQTKLSEERNAGGKSKNCRLQETMLQWAAHRLDGVDAIEWQRLAQERHPSAVMEAVGCAAASIATDAKLGSSAWTDAQKLFGSGKEMVAKLRHAGEQRMDKNLYSSLEAGYISNCSLSYALVAQESPSLGILHKWIAAVVDYQRARYMEDGEAELQQQLAGCQNGLQSARERRSSLMEQAELINTGNCYFRTQAVRSVPIDCVLHLMTAEKVTTRQYLLKEAAPMKLLDEVMGRPFVSTRGSRGNGLEDSLTRNGFQSARTVDVPGLRGNRTNAGVDIPPIHIPKVESARTMAWMGDRFARNQRSLENEAGGKAAGSSNGVDTVTIPKASPRYASNLAATEAVDSGAETPVPVANGAHPNGAAAPSLCSSSATPSPTTPSIRVEVKQRGESASDQGRALSARHGGAEPMQVLTDVRNNFKNVQAVLLACLEDYQELEDKYASTVEHSKQLLQTLESRDQAIARLQQELSAAVASQTSRKGVPTQVGGGGANHAARRRIPEDMHTSGSATTYVPDADIFGDGDSFEQRFEQMLFDTLEFLQGAESTPSIYENVSSQK